LFAETREMRDRMRDSKGRERTVWDKREGRERYGFKLEDEDVNELDRVGATGEGNGAGVG
jgi:hypothetical protein